MKRIISIILVLACALCLVACGNKEPKEKQLTLGFNTNGLTNETMSFMVMVMQKYCDDHGIAFMTAQDGGDTATCQNNLENMVAGGCDGIIFMNYDPRGIAPMAQELHDKGIGLVSYDELSDICDYSWLCANYDLGYAIGSMAADWANEHLPDGIDIWMGLMSAEGAEFMMNRSNGIEDGFAENIKQGYVFRVPATGGNSADCWNNMLSANPDLRICASVADAAVTGVAEAWYADLVGQGKDISGYGVFSTDATDIALNLINMAKKGKGIYRGTIDLGLKNRIPTGMIECLHAAVEHRESGYPKINYYEVKRVTEENIEEYAQFLDE